MSAIEKFTSAKGKLSWVFITGEGKDNYNEDGKIYSATASFEGKTMEAELERIKDFWEENKPEGIDEPTALGFSISDVETSEMADSTLDERLDRAKKEGIIHMVFSTGTTFPNGSAKVIKTFNSKGLEVQLNGKMIGNGSEGCLLGSMAIWERGKKGTKKHNAGVTFYLDGVQIVKFVEYSGIAEMEEYEDGFTGDEPEGLASQEADEDEPVKKKTGKPRL